MLLARASVRYVTLAWSSARDHFVRSRIAAWDLRSRARLRASSVTESVLDGILVVVDDGVCWLCVNH